MNFTWMVVLISLGLALVSYLIGSVNFAIMITKKVAHTDVREHGSGNAGMTNVLRTAGKKAAAATYLCDFLKGLVSALIGRFCAYALLCAFSDGGAQFDPLNFVYIAGIFCMIGHIFPVFFGFRGGKGVAALSGIMLGVQWVPFLVAVATFLLMVAVTRIVSVSSMTAALTLPFTTFFFCDNAEYTYHFLGLSPRFAPAVLSFVFAMIVVLTHIPNIKRLIHGEEKRFGGKKKA